MADRIVIMRDGHIVQVASPQQILSAPADEFVANFIGRQRLLRQTSEMLVGEIMTRSAVTIPAQSSLAQSLETMLQKGVETIVAVDNNGKFKGFACLGDLKEASAQVGEMPIEAFSKLNDLTIRSESAVINGMYLMIAHRIDEIPVTKTDGTVVGTVTRVDLVELLNGVVDATLTNPSS